RLTDAVDYLINTGLIQRGASQCRHLVSDRKETFLKTSPCVIRADKNSLAAAESININVDEYEPRGKRQTP
ncbi:unnamed protein product, partial [Rotaria sp. Silwood1]